MEILHVTTTPKALSNPTSLIWTSDQSDYSRPLYQLSYCRFFSNNKFVSTVYSSVSSTPRTPSSSLSLSAVWDPFPLFSTLLSSLLLYSSLLRTTLLSTLLRFSTPRYSPLYSSPLLYSTPLCSTPLPLLNTSPSPASFPVLFVVRCSDFLPVVNPSYLTRSYLLAWSRLLTWLILTSRRVIPRACVSTAWIYLLGFQT